MWAWCRQPREPGRQTSVVGAAPPVDTCVLNIADKGDFCMETRLTRYGQTVGYLAEGRGSDNEQRVLDAGHRTVGYINDHGTFDLNRRRVADYPDPGLLLHG